MIIPSRVLNPQQITEDTNDKTKFQNELILVPCYTFINRFNKVSTRKSINIASVIHIHAKPLVCILSPLALPKLAHNISDGE